MPVPLRCGALLGGAVCDQPILQISTSSVRNKLADQQRPLLEVAMRRRPALITGQEVSAGQWFAALKATAMLVRLGVPEVLPLLDAPLHGQGALAAEVGGHRWNRAGPVGRFGMAPRTALVAAGLLAVALEVAAAEGESELVARLMPLAAAARTRWKERRPGSRITSSRSPATPGGSPVCAGFTTATLEPLPSAEGATAAVTMVLPASRPSL
jgi:hypothetical protein